MFDLDKHFAIHASALRLSALRSELLARNLANADTPKYKATDIDFQKALSQALGESAAGTLRTTRSLHLAGANAAGDGVGGARVEFVERQPLTPSLDDNTVDVSMEQAEFAKNAIRYQASLNFINSQMRGLELVYDGAAPDTVRKVLEVEMSVRESADLAATKVYEGMGVYAPTLGIIGAVFGLIAVMNNLQDPSKLGPGIAAAFTATIYGIGTANLFMLPFASKLKQLVAMQGQTREMIVDGLAAIAEGENPRIVEAKLQGYLIRNTPVVLGEKPAEEKAG